MGSGFAYYNPTQIFWKRAAFPLRNFCSIVGEEMGVLWESAKRYLCPPGEGVHTLAAGGGRKGLLRGYAPGPDPWREGLKRIESVDSSPLLLGICSDAGGGILRGAAWGPLYVRGEILDEIRRLGVWDVGDVRVIPHLLHDKYLNRETLRACRKSLYGDPSSTLPVSPLSIAEDFLTEMYRLDGDKRVFGIGGDHSCSYPLVASFLRAKKASGVNVALIHFDAHTDLLRERLGIDLCFATWTAKVLPWLVSPDYCVQLGIRATLRCKQQWESEFGIKQYWADEILSDCSAVTADLMEYLNRLDVDEIYISFDIDALDRSCAPCTGTPEDNGLEPHHCISLIGKLAGRYPVTGCDLMEVAPLTHGTSPVDQKTTLLSAKALSTALLQAMGKNRTG